MTATPASSLAGITVVDRRIPDTASSDAVSGGGEVAHLERPAYLGDRARPKWLGFLVRASIPTLLVATWWWYTRPGRADPQLFASPSAVWDAFREIQQNGQLSEFLAASASRAGWGLLFGAGIGLILGVAAGLTRLSEQLVDPTMQIVRAVPFLAAMPLFVLWFGIEEKFKIVLIATATSLPMYGYAYLGVRNVDRKLVEAARGFGLRGPRLIAKVIIPSALPNILMALRICLVLTMTALIIAEGIGTDKGIGYLVLLGKQYARTDYTYLSIVLYAVLGLFFDFVVRTREKYSMPWRRHTTTRG
jgi:sulfonate transport system permease protein